MSWLGLATAPHTPRPIIDRLNAETRRALELADIRQKLADGGNIPTPTTPEQMASQIENEIANWKRIVEANNIKVD
jgi:tripartite-type tricarboxylate transporter receptor subunit TctC